MSKINNDTNRASELKKSFSVLEGVRQIDGIQKIIFYIIPKVEEEKFLTNPSLIDTSANAKEFYKVDFELYRAEKQKYDVQVDEIFDDLLQTMGAVGDW